ncbi:hypothetical protein QBC38DRAFT_447867 [Podospora fimiseda]|uniref:Uncharacterized protein n=1 Tax=Podospora fimiseda TaxID=252190 RepID=A0AAN7BGS7_9PEZI|nr:hypothetical protein QBC38DRAFT_447867 [Podospora fimiseda]
MDIGGRDEDRNERIGQRITVGSTAALSIKLTHIFRINMHPTVAEIFERPRLLFCYNLSSGNVVTINNTTDTKSTIDTEDDQVHFVRLRTLRRLRNSMVIQLLIIGVGGCRSLPSNELENGVVWQRVSVVCKHRSDLVDLFLLFPGLCVKISGILAVARHAEADDQTLWEEYLRCMETHKPMALLDEDGSEILVVQIHYDLVPHSVARCDLVYCKWMVWRLRKLWVGDEKLGIFCKFLSEALRFLQSPNTGNNSSVPLWPQFARARPGTFTYELRATKEKLLGKLRKVSKRLNREFLVGRLSWEDKVWTKQNSPDDGGREPRDWRGHLFT